MWSLYEMSKTRRLTDEQLRDLAMLPSLIPYYPGGTVKATFWSLEVVRGLMDSVRQLLSVRCAPIILPSFKKLLLLSTSLYGLFATNSLFSRRS